MVLNRRAHRCVVYRMIIMPRLVVNLPSAGPTMAFTKTGPANALKLAGGLGETAPLQEAPETPWSGGGEDISDHR